MSQKARWVGVTLTLGCVSSAACSTVLGLEAPPASEDAGVPADATMPGDAGPAGDVADAGEEAIDASSVAVCTPLDAGTGDSATSYTALGAGALDEAGSDAWELFDTSRLPRRAAFNGGAFDGRYVYLAGKGTVVARFDTGGGSFQDAASWSIFDVAPLGAPGGFAGAVFDGRYVYFVPSQAGSTRTSVVVRLDSQGPFASAASWATFDTSTLTTDGGAVASGFFGGGFDGRYVYFVPHNDGAPDGRVVRYDTTPPDGGILPDAEAGDAGGSGAFGDPALWATFDVSTTNPIATGFAGAVFDGRALYLVPNANDAFDGAVRSGTSGVAARLRLDGGFEAPASWSTFDLTNVNGLATNFIGAAFDGRYVYFAPRGSAILPRLDTTAGAFSSTSAWATYDLTRVVATDAGLPQYAGAAFDGRFVYFVPTGVGFATLTRYDTRSTFTADCAWSTLDLAAALGAGDAGTTFYVGAVFDGQYLYLVPGGNIPVARFRAKTPPAMPPLPAFHGSFL